MQGSCRPLISSIFLFPFLSTVCCFLAIEEVGLKATRNTMSIPLLTPPNTPPAWLVLVTTLPFVIKNSSLCSDPFISTPLKPLPISNPFAPGMLSMDWARRASNLLKTGLPSPAGAFLITHSTSPPIESPSFLAVLIAFRVGFTSIALICIFGIIFFAMAAAATRVAVSRALARPPPL